MKKKKKRKIKGRLPVISLLKQYCFKRIPKSFYITLFLFGKKKTCAKRKNMLPKSFYISSTRNISISTVEVIKRMGKG